MGVYIAGMEMPKRGMVVNIYADGRVTDHFDEFGRTIGKAVTVPPHGRLIDADALADKHRTKAYENGGRSYSFHASAKAWVEDAPIIIPADPEEEEMK